jgi:23S rRNA (cytosine1962-C5)-methyltransferase
MERPMDHETLLQRLDAALGRRHSAGLPAAGRTTAFRLLHDAADDVPGLLVDAFGDVAVARLRTPAWQDPERVRTLAGVLAQRGWGRMWALVDEKAKGERREHERTEQRLNELLERLGHGAPEEPFEVLEGGLRYEVSVREGFSQGLFLDMRPVRTELRRRWRNRDVLNLFAYTCGFGVALAAHNRVTNVDAAGKYLAWGRRNYELNGLPVDDTRFVEQDVFGFLDAAIAQRQRWDAVVLDPPAYSRGKGNRVRSFSVRKDLGELVEKALDVLNDQGELFLATNFEGLSQDAFRRLVIGIARDRGTWLMKQWGPAPDHPTRPEQHHLKTALLLRQRKPGARKPTDALETAGTRDREATDARVAATTARRDAAAAAPKPGAARANRSGSARRGGDAKRDARPGAGGRAGDSGRAGGGGRPSGGAPSPKGRRSGRR